MASLEPRNRCRRRLSCTISRDSFGLVVSTILRLRLSRPTEYSTSASFEQLSGKKQTKSELRIKCDSGYLVASDDDLYWPCGLMANSMFTDQFKLVSPDVRVKETGISWSTDVEKVQIQPRPPSAMETGDTLATRAQQEIQAV